MCSLWRCGLLAGETKPISTLDRISLFEFAGDRPVQGWIAPRSVEAEFRADDRFRHFGWLSLIARPPFVDLGCRGILPRFIVSGVCPSHLSREQFLCQWPIATLAMTPSGLPTRNSSVERCEHESGWGKPHTGYRNRTDRRPGRPAALKGVNRCLWLTISTQERCGGSNTSTRSNQPPAEPPWRWLGSPNSRNQMNQGPPGSFVSAMMRDMAPLFVPTRVAATRRRSLPARCDAVGGR